MDAGKKESGYALLYALGAIILVSVIVGSIFLLARNTFMQVETVDKFKRLQDVKEYVLQDGSYLIKKELETKLSALERIEFGKDTTKLKTMVDSLFSGFSKERNDFGSQNQFSYKVKIDSITAKMVEPYAISNEEGSFGWKPKSNLTGVTNTQLVFRISADIIEKKSNQTETNVSTIADYVYEIQWEEIEIETEIVELDVWRNVFYPYYLPNGAGNISADEWMRKFDRIYRYQKDTKLFNYPDYKNDISLRDGYIGGHVVDMEDGKLLDFTSEDKQILKTLDFEGSMFFRHGVSLKGSGGGSALGANNLLVFSDQKSQAKQLNVIEDLNIFANVGTYFDFSGEKSKLLLTGETTSLQTSNLLINNSNSTKKANNSKEGILLSKGKIEVKKIPEASSFSFSNYQSEASKKSPNDEYWNSFLQGGMVIASSNLYGGPTNEMGDYLSDEEDARHILVDGNFMLTNAKLSSAKGEKEFSYFMEEDNFDMPNKSSTLTLDGSDTKFIVSGKSFIDAPKTKRRASLGEKEVGEFVDYYRNSEYWNSIELKNGAQMYLDYTGMEPFNLSVSEDSIFSFKLLPNNVLLDTTFLIEGNAQRKLKGKIVIYPFSQVSVDELKKKLGNSMPVNQIDRIGDAKNGEISIVNSSNYSSEGSAEIITRTFDFIEKVEY